MSPSVMPISYAHCTLVDACLTDEVVPLAQERGVGVINAAAVALGLLAQAGPARNIAQLVGEEICTIARPSSRCASVRAPM